MNSEYFIKKAMDHIKDELVITNIGNISKITYHVKDRAKNFYMIGSMGLCTSIGLGLSLSTKNRVVCMEGDGSLLMNFNTLPTLAKYKPDNLCIFLLDNRSYETTGSQASYDITEFNLGELLRSVFEDSYHIITSEEKLNTFYETDYNSQGFKFVHIMLGFLEKQYPLVPYECEYIKNRFMKSI